MTPEPTAALVDARRDALLESGWGATFRFLQPRNAAFWVYLLLCAQGGLFFLAMVRSQGDYYAPAVQLTLVALVLYGIVLWWFFRRIDRYARQSRKFIIVGFFWGHSAPRTASRARRTPRSSVCGRTCSARRGPTTGHPV